MWLWKGQSIISCLVLYALHSAGIQSKSKPKFSFRFQPRREGLFSPVSKNDNSIPCKVDELPERMETADCEKHSIAGLLGGFPGKKATQSEMVPDEVEDPHWCDDHSVAKHLDSLRDNSSLLRRNSKMVAFFFHQCLFPCTALYTQSNQMSSAE